MRLAAVPVASWRRPPGLAEALALGARTLTWDAQDHLASVHAATLIEAYAWTDDGRMAARYTSSGLSESFVGCDARRRPRLRLPGPPALPVHRRVEVLGDGVGVDAGEVVRHRTRPVRQR